MRTIQAPGVEIKEIDKSQYAKTETGTKCFVTLRPDGILFAHGVDKLLR